MTILGSTLYHESTTSSRVREQKKEEALEKLLDKDLMTNLSGKISPTNTLDIDQARSSTVEFHSLKTENELINESSDSKPENTTPMMSSDSGMKALISPLLMFGGLIDIEM